MSRKRRDRAVLLALRLFADPTGHSANMPLRDLATAAGLDVEAVYLAVRALHRADVIRMAGMGRTHDEPSLILLDRRYFPPGWRNIAGEVC